MLPEQQLAESPPKRHTTKGHFLLMTARETLETLEGSLSAASLNEAYADAAFFK